MKTSFKINFLIITNLFLLIPLFLFAQNNSTVLFKADFTPVNIGQKIPFGEKVLFRNGEDSPGLEKLTVEIYHGLNTQIIEANINENGWSAVVGPFDQKQSLIINFKVKKMLVDKDWQVILDKLKISALIALDSLAERNVSWTDAELTASIKQLFVLPEEFKKYQSEDGTVTVYDKISQFLDDTSQLLAFTELASKSSEIRNAISDFNKLIQVEIKKTLLNPNTVIPDSDETKKNRILQWRKIKEADLPSENDKDIETSYAALIIKLKNAGIDFSMIHDDTAYLARNVRDLVNARNRISEILKSIFGNVKFFTSEYFSASFTNPTDIDVSGIQKYIGVDIGALAYDKGKAVVGVNILLSPYLGKIEPDDDLQLCDKKFLKALFTVLTPTVGIQIVTLTKADSTIGVTFFAGGSVRINKLVRVTTGSSFYIENNKLIHHWSMGLSITVSSFGDLLKIIGGAASNFKP